MKYSTFSKSAFAVTAILVATACGSDATPADDQVPTETAAPTPAPTPAATPPKPIEKKCPASCTTDAECMNACPAISGGVQCCDLKSGACFGSPTATCPAQSTDPTDPMMPY